MTEKENKLLETPETTENLDDTPEKALHDCTFALDFYDRTCILIHIGFSRLKTFEGLSPHSSIGLPRSGRVDGRLTDASLIPFS